MRLSIKILLALILAGFVNHILFLVARDWIPLEEGNIVLLSRGTGIVIGYTCAMHVFRRHK